MRARQAVSSPAAAAGMRRRKAVRRAVEEAEGMCAGEGRNNATKLRS